MKQSANCGYFTQILTSTLPASSTIIAIEPNQIMCARAETNFKMLRAAGMAKNVTIKLEQCAVGETSQTSRLYIPEGPNGFGGASIATDDNGIDIQMSCLEEILARNNVSNIDALKIDIEGYVEESRTRSNAMLKLKD